MANCHTCDSHRLIFVGQQSVKLHDAYKQYYLGPAFRSFNYHLMLTGGLSLDTFVQQLSYITEELTTVAL